MIVIGLDGMEWPMILERGEEKMPTFFKIMRDWKWDTLWVDGIPHTAPSWTTIWTGAKNEEHGIQDFERFDENGVKRERNTPDRIKQAFVWERLYRRGMKVGAFDIYCTLPPTNYYTEYETPLEFALTLTVEEMRSAMSVQLNKLRAMLTAHLEFIAFTNIVPDKAHHIQHKEKKGKEYLDEMYSLIDTWLGQCINSAYGHTIVILSDHGRPGPAWKHEHGGTTPAHLEAGIIACNNYPPVKSTSSVADWLLKIAIEEHDGKLSDEQERILNERLQALGYIE